MPEPTVAASLIVDLLAYLEARGVSRDEACRAAGLDPRLTAGEDARVPNARAERLWAFGVARTGDPLLALHTAEGYNPGALDIVGYVILSCRTVGEVLDRLARYAGILNDGLRVRVEVEGDVAWCRLAFVAPEAEARLGAGQAIVADAMLGGIARELGRLAARPIPLREAWLRHEAPAALHAEYRRVLGTARVRFGAPDDRVAIAAADLALPVRSANPALLARFEREADAAWAALADVTTVRGRVAHEVATRLRGEPPAIGDVARALAMSPRNLQRTLRHEGTSYVEIVESVRRELALRHLAHPDTPVGHVALLLGFSEPSAFHRAFRRWTGTTPARWREGAANRSLAP